MRRLITPGLVGMLCLHACTVPVQRAAADRTPAPREARRSAPTPSPTPSPSATPTPIATPSGPVRALSGKVLVDASYMIKAGIAQLVANNGGSVVSAAGGSLIAPGAGLLSNNGGGLISDKGAGIVSHNGGAFRVLAAEAVKPGTLLPAEGMLVVPLSLTTGEPLGPAVRTGGDGAYRLTVPEAQAQNVLLFAAVPGKSESDPVLADPRLRYGLLQSAKDERQATIDEDAALITRYMMTVFTQRLNELISVQTADLEAYLDSQFQTYNLNELGPLREIIRGQLREVHTEADKAGIPGKPAAAREDVARRLGAALVAHVDLESLRTNPTYYNLTDYGYADWEATKAAIDPNKSPTTYMREVFAHLRERVGGHMERHGGAFPNADYLARYNQRRTAAGLPPYEIKRPTDFGDMVVAEYIVRRPQPDDPSLESILGTMDAATMPGSGLIVEGLIRMAYVSILVTLQQTMIANPEAKSAVIALLREAP